MAPSGFGRVMNIVSVHGLVASAAKGPYVVAKHGIVGLTKVATLEYANVGSRESGGVSVNAICPGRKEPSRRMSSPDEIGELALWLCSKSAHNITGASILIDGGWTAQ